MKARCWHVLLVLSTFVLVVLAFAPMPVLAEPKVAAKPVFRDPVFDGAADAVIVWNRAEKKWFMLYTNRRAKAPPAETPGVTWVHGTRIGIAESSDGGASWTYRGVAEIDIKGEPDQTHWAPDVIEHEGTYHMYLTYVPGIFTDWNHPRKIVHLSSADLIHWKYESELKLVSDRVIDASVMRLPNGGGWRMWYNEERSGKSIYYADSKDLSTWEDRGKAPGVDPRGEGPKAFRWKDRSWLIVDHWEKGIGVYSSDDCVTWKRQPTSLLLTPGKGADDGVHGGHADVVVNGDRAYLFYFTHPGRAGRGGDSEYDRRRSSIQVVELQLADDGQQITCDRDKPTYINLEPPQ